MSPWSSYFILQLCSSLICGPSKHNKFFFFFFHLLQSLVARKFQSFRGMTFNLVDLYIIPHPIQYKNITKKCNLFSELNYLSKTIRTTQHVNYLGLGFSQTAALQIRTKHIAFVPWVPGFFPLYNFFFSLHLFRGLNPNQTNSVQR